MKGYFLLTPPNILGKPVLLKIAHPSLTIDQKPLISAPTFINAPSGFRYLVFIKYTQIKNEHKNMIRFTIVKYFVSSHHVNYGIKFILRVVFF